MNKLSNALLAATALTTGLGFVGAAHAAAISTTFNFVPLGTLTANNGNILTATSITSGAPLIVTGIVTDNTGLLAGQAVSITSPTPVTVGASFTKSFATTLGDFVETLTVTSNNPSGTSLGVDASGTIVETLSFGGPSTMLSSSPVFYTASYTQNDGPGAQINASFNNSTTPPPPPSPPGIPEPASMALLGTALVGLGALRRRRRG